MGAALSAPRELWPDEIVVFGAASEAFSQKNINCSIAESIDRFADMIAMASWPRMDSTASSARGSRDVCSAMRLWHPDRRCS